MDLTLVFLWVRLCVLLCYSPEARPGKVLGASSLGGTFPCAGQGLGLGLLGTWGLQDLQICKGVEC